MFMIRVTEIYNFPPMLIFFIFEIDCDKGAVAPEPAYFYAYH